MPVLIPRWGGSFGTWFSGDRCEPGLQFAPDVFRRGLDSLGVPMGIEGVVQQFPGLGLPLEMGEKVNQRELDLLRQRADGLDHIGADGALPGRGLQKTVPVARRRILGIHLALRGNIQEDR